MRPTGANTRMLAWRLSPISTAAPPSQWQRRSLSGVRRPEARIAANLRQATSQLPRITLSQPAGLGVLVGAAAATVTIGKREHGTALGPAPDRLAVSAAPESLGSRRAADGARGDRARRLGRHGDERALSCRRGSTGQPRPLAATG